ncbi:hypothetical protein [Acinetobacter ursingii]|uniref:hypothetical protein n=1 Tax=Acinetobacter ursingii TaxID=108980 RepID=UPI003AF74CAF
MPKYLESIIATTLVDKQNEKLSLEALKSLIDSLNNYNIPINVEHDPRKAPIGRVINGFIREREDSEFEAVAVLEFFDGDWKSLEGNHKEFPVFRANELLHLSYSYSHKNELDQNDIRFIDKLLNSQSNYEAKKSADPISIISLTGAFILGGIASGFLSKVGEEIWELLKPKIINLVSKNKKEKSQDLLIFRMIISKSGVFIEVDVILTNPCEEDIDQFLARTTIRLDMILEDILDLDSEIRKVVFEQKNDKLFLNYAVRRDCIPLIFNIVVV